MNNELKISLKKLFGEIVYGHRVFYGRNLKQKVVSLTFDDGPFPGNTEEILSILQEERVRATFFLLGKEIDRFPLLSQKYTRHSHEIGSHSYFHTSAISIDDVKKSLQCIQQTVGFVPKLFRPPYGNLNKTILDQVYSDDLDVVMWSYDAYDSSLRTPESLIRLFRRKPVTAGDIILLHEDYVHTRDALRDIIRIIRSQGFDFVTVSELMEVR